MKSIDKEPSFNQADLPGARNATRVSGLNGGRVFGEGDGRANHPHNLSSADRQIGNQSKEVQENPTAFHEIIQLGSPRDPWTPGGREPLSVWPGPGRYPRAQDGTPAERGVTRERGTIISGSFPVKRSDDAWDPMDGSFGSETKKESTGPGCGTRQPI
jgi:hypothetical protein